MASPPKKENFGSHTLPSGESPPILITTGWEHAVVVHANRLQFGAGERVSFARVESRMLLWCTAGRGKIKVNRQSFEIEPDLFLLLPWRHSILYESDQRDPYLMSGIHVVPWHDRGIDVEFSVAHDPDHVMMDAPWRREAALHGAADPSAEAIDGVIVGSMKEHPALRHLAEYIQIAFNRSTPEEAASRSYARLLGRELANLDAEAGVYASRYPVELTRIARYILDHLDRPLRINDLIDFSELSASTIGRLFRRHLDVSPNEWILRARIDRACELLRTSRHSVAEVGRRVGFEDPYYFSKCFKKRLKKSPLRYRKENGLL